MAEGVLAFWSTVWDLLQRLDFDARLNTYGTLLVFLPTVVAVHWLLRNQQHRLLWLTGSSLLFYSFWDWRFAPLLILSSLADFYFGLKAASDQRSTRWLWASAVFNLGLLAIFKYLILAITSWNAVSDLFGRSGALPVPNIILPIGISFYTFQTISYTVDCWRGTIAPTRNFVQFMAYVTLFPQLVAGPIVRFSEVGPNLGKKQEWDAENFKQGMERLAIGLIKKVLIADQIAIRIDPAWDSGVTLSSWGAFMAMAGFTVQIFLDISAYSDMAIGVGRMLGLHFPENFNRPFRAKNVQEFWSRNHLSLSRFIRDYLYIPLGGNRGNEWVKVRTLLLTFGLAGLWHGAAWTFLIWGLCHGIALVIHRHYGSNWALLPTVVQRTGWMLFHIFTMTLFRADSLSSAIYMWASMGNGLSGWSPSSAAIVLIISSFAVSTTSVHSLATKIPFKLRDILIGILTGFTLFAMRTQQTPFEYFQF